MLLIIHIDQKVTELKDKYCSLPMITTMVCLQNCFLTFVLPGFAGTCPQLLPPPNQSNINQAEQNLYSAQHKNKHDVPCRISRADDPHIPQHRLTKFKRRFYSSTVL